MKANIHALIMGASLLALGAGSALADTSEPQAGNGGMRATRALNMLEAAGDGQYSNFVQSGRNFTADVMKNGSSMHVLINPASGQITQMAALDRAPAVDAASAPVAPAPAMGSGDGDLVTHWHGRPEVKDRLPGAPY